MKSGKDKITTISILADDWVLDLEGTFKGNKFEDWERFMKATQQVRKLLKDRGFDISKPIETYKGLNNFNFLFRQEKLVADGQNEV